MEIITIEQQMAVQTGLSFLFSAQLFYEIFNNELWSYRWKFWYLY